MWDLRRIRSGMMSSKARGRSFSSGMERRAQGSSRAVAQSAADFAGASLLASRRGVESGRPAGAAEGGAGGADTLAEGAGAVAGGAAAVGGAADGVADSGGGAAAGADGIAAGDAGGAVASLDCRKIRSCMKEPTDDSA
jgi:hypothetical protein